MGASKPGAKMQCFNEQRKECDSVADALEWLVKNYGIRPPKRIHDGNSVFRDTKSRGTVRCGFIVHRWNSDISHNSKAWWEQNWISFETVDRCAVADVSAFLKAA